MKQMTKKVVGTIFFLFLTINLACAWQLRPFETSYSATVSDIPFDGQATYTLKKEGNRWLFKTLAVMAIAQRTETSDFILSNGYVQPSSYVFDQVGIKPKEVSLLFDWKKMFAKGTMKDKKHSKELFFDLKYGMLDPLSTQLALQMDVANGKKQMSYRVIEDEKIEVFQFKVVGTEIIDTPVGKLSTVKVERVREANSKRQSYIWFAKKWNYTVVKLSHLEKNGQQYVISLASGSVNGKAIKGK